MMLKNARKQEYIQSFLIGKWFLKKRKNISVQEITAIKM